MNLQEALVAFRKSVWFRIFYLVVLSVIVYALLFIDTCFMLLTIPVSMFVFPYWLKERGLKTQALNGVFVTVLAGLIFASILASSISGTDPEPVGGSASGIVLGNGIVTPPRGAPGDTFNFTVNLTIASGGSPSNVSVYANLSEVTGTELRTGPGVLMVETNASDTDLTDGKQYYAEFPVADKLWWLWFAVEARGVSASTWVETTGQFAPLVAGFGAYMGFTAVYAYLSLLLPVSLYYLILMLVWYQRRARVERQRLGISAPQKETDTGFMCTNCGADVPEDSDRCPKCGASFDEEAGPPEGGAGPAKPPADAAPAEPEGKEPEGPDAKP